MNKYQYTIYGLVDPFSGLIRYVGVTRQHIMTRLEGHLKSVKNEESEKSSWLKHLLNLNERPVPIVLTTANDEDEAFRREAHFIKYGQLNGWPLTNVNIRNERHPTYDDQHLQIIDLVKQGNTVSEIVLKVWNIRGGRRYAECSKTVMETIRKELM